jgi:hypothetical protein
MVRRKVWRPVNPGRVVSVVSSVATDEKYPEVESVVVSVRTPGRRAPCPWVVSSCERPPVGWTDLPWWKDGKPLDPDFSSVSGPDVLSVGSGSPMPKFRRFSTWTDVEVRERCAKPNPSPYLVREYRRRFGRPCTPIYAPVPAVQVLKEPVVTQIENAEGRTLAPDWETYRVPNLALIGFEGVSTPGALGLMQNYFAFTVEKDSLIEVTVPAGLVAKLGEFWAYKEKDAAYANFLVSVDKLRNLLRVLAISAEQSKTAAMYVPAIAFNRYMQQGDHVARMATGGYVSREKWAALLAMGAATLASFPATVAAAAVGAAGTGVMLGGGAAAAAVAGVAWLYLKNRSDGKRRYARVYSTQVCHSLSPERLNPTARVECKAVPEVPVDKVREAVRVVGLASETYLPTVYADNHYNQLKALEKRVLAEPPPHDAAKVKEFCCWFKANAKRIIGEAVRIKSKDWDKWIMEMNASVPVKLRLRNAKAALTARGQDENTVFSKDELYRATSREAFTKFETVLTGTRFEDSVKACRLIQGAHPEMTAIVGPWITALQGRVKRTMDGTSGLMFTSGKTTREVAAFIGEAIDAGWKPFDDDVSAYDLSMIVDYGLLEVWICKYMHCPAAIAQLMEANIDTHGWTSLGWKYQVRGTRKSGDTFTSLMNSILNLAFHLFVFCQERSCGVPEALTKLRMAAQGDDDIGAHEGPEVDWKAGMAQLGFKSEPHYHDHVARIEFCSHYLSKDSAGWTMFPKVGRLLAKAGVSLRAVEGQEAAYARATAKSLAGACGSCPPLRAYIDRVLQLTEGERDIRLPDEPWKMKPGVAGEPTSETWEHLHERYGYTREMHAQFEAELRGMQLGQPVDCPIFNHLCSVDTDGQACWDVRPYGLDLITEPCGPDDEQKEMTFTVTGAALEGSVPVVVKVGKTLPSAGFIVKRAYDIQQAGTPKARDVELLVGGRVVHPAHVPLGQAIEVRARGRGGMLGVVSGLGRPGIWLTRVVSEVVAGAATEAAVTELKDAAEEFVWVDTTLPSVLAASKAPESPKEAGPVKLQRVAVVFSGRTLMVDTSASTVGDVVLMALHLKAPMLAKLEVIQDGRVCGWTDIVSPSRHLSVRAKGLGGATISRSESILNRVENRTGVLQTSRPWLLSRLDPMHDNSVGLGGYPDGNSGMSVPMCLRSSMQVVSAQGSTANWDANVVFYPDANLTSVMSVNRISSPGFSTFSNVLQNPAITATYGVGGISVYQATSGTSLTLSTFSQGISYIPNNVVSIQRTVPTIQGPWRLTALGMEIVNTTADLYAQGTLTTWLQPTLPPSAATTYVYYDSTALSGATNYLPGATSTLVVPAPPDTVQEANILSGSKQWHAKKGVYMTARPSQDDLPILSGQVINTVYYQNTQADTTLLSPVFGVGNVGGSTGVNISTPQITSVNPYHQMGAYFTGLSPQTTFTVNVWAFVEIFPEQLGNTLTPLAQPSAPYDEQALRLYSEIIKAMPIAVELSENGFGDWLADLAGKAVNVVGGIASTVGRVANAIGAGVSSYNNSAPSSDSLRGDGVAKQIAQERRVEKKVVNDRTAAVAARNKLAMENMKLRLQMAEGKKAFAKSSKTKP